MRFFDNSRVSDCKRCPRYFYLRHDRDLVREHDFGGVAKAPALVFGSCWHDAMDAVWQALWDDQNLDNQDVVAEGYKAFLNRWLEEGMLHPDEMAIEESERLNPRLPSVAYEMLYAYAEQRGSLLRNPDFELLAVEQPFAVPLDPEDPDLFYVGRLDKVFSLRDEIFVGEHKTSSMYRVGGPFRNSFLDSFSPNSQVDGYIYAAHSLFGDNVKGVWVDAALVHKNVHDGFQIIPVERNIAQIDAWLWEARYWISWIEHNRDALTECTEGDKFLSAFPKNTSACMDYGGCQFADICKGHANPYFADGPPPGFRQEHWSPFEELELTKIGFEPGIAD